MHQQLNQKVAKKKVKRGAPFPRKCITKRCRGLVIASVKGWLCAKCKSKAYKQRDPLRYHYNLLRCRAKERGKVFNLSFERYAKLAEESGYHANRGKKAESLSLDRINPNRGYEDDNVRVVTLSWNTKMRYVPYWRDMVEEWEAQYKLNGEHELAQIESGTVGPP